MADHPFKTAIEANPIVPADAATAVERHAVFVAHDLADIRTRDLAKTKHIVLIDFTNLVVRRYVYNANSTAADDGYTTIWDSQERAFGLDAGQAFDPDIIVVDITARDALSVSGEAVGYSVLVTDTAELHFLTDPATPTWSAGISFGAGTPGASGADGGLAFDFSTLITMVDPGAGVMRFNNATIGSVTAIAIDDATADTGNPDLAAYINTWAASTSTIKGYLIVQKAAAKENFAVFQVDGLTDNTGWSQITVTHVDSAGSLADTDRLAVIFIRNGDKGDTGATGATGSDGADGSDGANGADGYSPGFRFAWSTNVTDSDPGSGTIKADNATFGSITKLWTDNLDAAAADITAWLDGLDDGTTANHKGYLRIEKDDDPNAYMEFVVTGAVVDKTGYREIPVSPVVNAGTIADTDNLVLNFSRTGDKGADGAGTGDVVGPASAVDDRIAAFDTTTGKLIKDSGSKVSDLLPLAGGTMTGLLTLAGAPTSTLHAATKAYVDGIVAAADAATVQGGQDCSTNPNYPAADAGHQYRVTVAGKIGGGSGPDVEVGDIIMCFVDSTATGDHATVGANWEIIQANLDGTYFAGGTDVPVADGGTGSSTAAGARTNLGAQAQGDVLDDLNTLGAVTADSEFLVGTAAGVLAWESGATVRASLGLGSAALLAEATAAQFRDNTADKALSTDQVWSAAAEVTLTDAATIAVDMDSFFNAKVTLGGNRTLGNPTNEKVGQEGAIRVIQDATGSRTLSFGTDYEFAGGTAPTLSTGANDEDLLFYKVLAANRVFIGSALDIS